MAKSTSAYLNVFVGAKLDGLSKGLKTGLGEAQGVLKTASGKITSGLTGKFAALGAGISAAGIGVAVNDQLKGITDIGRKASDIGTSVEAFSALAFAAQASGAEVEDISEAMKEFNLRISEANSLGTGAASGGVRHARPLRQRVSEHGPLGSIQADRRGDGGVRRRRPWVPR